ncbi:MAG: nuclear transport factor 2 family protein [Pyrinomonadaceae bacterium]|nr:nuclear transport factor 2 family protein [Pyrinomonadaceae bacterium]
MTKTEQLIGDVDSKLTAALLQGDSASVDAILADDYVEIDAQGSIRHKSDVMTLVRAQASAPRSTSIGPEITVDETRVLVYGDTAIIFTLTTTRYQFMEYMTLPQTTPAPSPSATDRHRLTKVYSKLNGSWQLIASQTTAIPKH